MKRDGESSCESEKNRKKDIPGIHWIDLPAKLGWGCDKLCRERLRDWHEAACG